MTFFPFNHRINVADESCATVLARGLHAGVALSIDWGVLEGVIDKEGTFRHRCGLLEDGIISDRCAKLRHQETYLRRHRKKHVLITRHFEYSANPFLTLPIPRSLEFPLHRRLPSPFQNG